MLTEAQYESAERIAWHVAGKHRSRTPFLTLDDRFEAALTGIIEEIHERGWPAGPVTPLFRAANNGIHREDHQVCKHIPHWAYWAAPGNDLDPVGERVAERVAVWQLAWGLTETQWQAAWAMGEAIAQDLGINEAAAMLGMGRVAFMHHLFKARTRARALWIAPGDTPRGMYRPASSGRKTRLGRYQAGQRYAAQRRQEEPA